MDFGMIFSFHFCWNFIEMNLGLQSHMTKAMKVSQAADRQEGYLAH